MQRSWFVALPMLALAVSVAAAPQEAADDARPVNGAESAAGATTVEILVKDDHGNPIHGAMARLAAFSKEGFVPLVECVSDGQGRCALQVAAGRNLTVMVGKTGFSTERCLLGSRSEMTMVLQRLSSVEGTVVDEDGRPFGPLSMYLVEVPSALPREGYLPATVGPIRADTHGDFRSENVPTGVYRVVLCTSGRVPVAGLFGLSPDVMVSPNVPVKGVVVRVIPHGRLIGRVVFPAGVPSRVTVTPILDPNSPDDVPRLTADEAKMAARGCDPVDDLECSFTFEGLYPAAYMIEVQADGYGLFLSPLKEQVRSAETTRATDFTAPRPVHLSGVVGDQGKQPVKGATVALSFPGVPYPVLEAKSDEKGRFGPLLVSPGTYEITVSHPQFVTKKERLPISKVSMDAEVNVALEAGSCLVGVYIGRDGAPLPGITVTAEPREGGATRSGSTDVNGRFSLGGLTAGRYTVRAVEWLTVVEKVVDVERDNAASIVLDATKDGSPAPGTRTSAAEPESGP